MSKRYKPMSRENYKLFSEGRLGGLSVKNRLVRSATYEACATDAGSVTEKMLCLYKDLAAGGVGTIITGHMAVCLSGRAMPRQTCIHSDAFIDDLARLAEAVHNQGDNCKVIAQLSHCGRQVTHHNHEAECVGPSEVPSPLLRKQCRKLTTKEVKKVIQDFAAGIERVKKAGFDGVQLHAAHGWLLSSFMSPYTNRRKDEYGGSLKNRTRIVREIAASARKKTGDFPLLIKINATDYIDGGISENTFPELAREVKASGFDAIEVSGGMWDCLVRTEAELGFRPMPIPEAHTRISSPEKQSYFSKAVESLHLDKPVILVGGNRNADRLEELLQTSAVDFISLSRPLISEPDLPRRWLEGKGSPGTDCVSCNSCLQTISAGGSLECMLKQNRIKQEIVRRFAPKLWKFLLK